MNDNNVLYYHKLLGHHIHKCSFRTGKPHNKKNMSKFMALNFMYDQYQQNVSIYAKDVGKHLGMNKSSTSEMIKSLESENMLKLVGDLQDGRLKKIELTDDAIRLVKKEREEFDNFYNRVIAGVSSEEIDEYIRISKKLINNMKEVENNA